MEPIRVFVGGTAEHELPLQVLCFSIRRRMKQPERLVLRALWDSKVPIPTPADPKNRGVTTFSFQRFVIPEECGFHGRAIYLDSDMLVLADIAELADWPFPAGVKVLSTKDTWQTAVMLIDCSIGWKVSEIVASLDRHEWSRQEVMNCVPEVKRGQFARTLPAQWNHQDRMSEETRLLHFTAMELQPWLRAGHPLGEQWEQELTRGMADGSIDSDLVRDSIQKRWIRPSLAQLIGEAPPYPDSDFVPPHRRGVA